MATKSVHFIGIGGVGMAGLAVLLKSRGYDVSGCDLHASPRTAWLEGLGIRVFIGHDPSHLAGVDEVVITPAVSRNEPELVSFRGSVRFRGEVLAEVVSESPDSIAVCGSHGKTTTSTWIAKLLLALGEEVSWCIGGETGSFPVAHADAIEQSPNPKSPNLKSNNSHPPLVVEADESDGTLALYKAKTLVVNKCEYDHPDHFKAEADYFACYEKAKRQAGTVIESETLDLGLFDLGLGDSGLSDCLKHLPAHNRRNARAAIEVALRRGHRLEDIAAKLPEIVTALPDRRFQIIWPAPSQSNNQPIPNQPIPNPTISNPTIKQSANSVTIVTDYAHHPTEMRCAVEMARQKCRGKLCVLFQPHRYSRTKALLANFPAAFEAADETILCPTYAAFEKPVEGGDVADLYKVCREQGTGNVGARRLFLARSCGEAWEHAFRSMKDGDLALLLGAGDIINLVPRVVADLSHPSQSSHPSQLSQPMRRIFIGAGSNTWKSDLNLNVEYVKTTGPASAPGASLGIPWMVGIPGTIGGWIKMNAGAFGHSISEVVEKVKVDGKWIPAAECGFAYRHSDIAGEIQDVILKVKDSGEGEQRNSSYYLSRRKNFPTGTFGSFFKNPPGDYAGRLLEAAGAKDLKVGGAYVWGEHANVIVRGEGATPSDVLALARLMRNRVLFRFGISLEPEVCGIVF